MQISCPLHTLNPGRPFIARNGGNNNRWLFSEGGTRVARVKLFWLNFTSVAAFLHAADPFSLSRGGCYKRINPTRLIDVRHSALNEVSWSEFATPD